MEYAIIPHVKKIAVLRALVLGDMMFILPALQALHNAYPEAEITLLARPWVSDFFRDRIPWLAQVVTFRSSPVDYEDLGFIIHPEDAAWFFPQMREAHFDIAISMQGGGKNSNPFVQRLGAKITIGSREEGAIALDRWIPYDYYQHDVIRNLDLAALAGAPPPGWTPQFPVLPFDLDAAAPFLEKIQRPFLVIHSGARDVRRCWAPALFAEVADYFKRRLGLEVVLTGSSVDDKVALEVENSMKERPVNLTHQLTLPALTGILSKSRLVISNDTGVLHLGLAVGARGVGLYWGEYISKSIPLSRKCFYPLISWERNCPICGMFLDKQEVVRADPRECEHQVSFINSITPEQVIAAAEKMLALEISESQV